MRIESVIFSGGGCRCFWQLGFWEGIQPHIEGPPPRAIGVSAGAFTACAALTGQGRRAFEHFVRATGKNKRNFYPEYLFHSSKRVFPHYHMYHDLIETCFSDAEIEHLRLQLNIDVAITRCPDGMGLKNALALGFLCCELECRLKERVHRSWSTRFGFRTEFVPVASCKNVRQLTDLLMASACVPPILRPSQIDGRWALDGGLVNNSPIPSEGDRQATRSLVLLTRPFRPDVIPRNVGHIYVQPSRVIPISITDYASPDKIRETYELGFRDGHSFSQTYR